MSGTKFINPMVHVERSGASSHRDLLAGVPALQVLSETELVEILRHVTVREYEDDEVIIQEGDEGKDMFIIQTGDAVCTKEGVNDGN
jgi:CRP-like cAMP-binding protein